MHREHIHSNSMDNSYVLRYGCRSERLAEEKNLSDGVWQYVTSITLVKNYQPNTPLNETVKRKPQRERRCSGIQQRHFHSFLYRPQSLRYVQKPIDITVSLKHYTAGIARQNTKSLQTFFLLLDFFTRPIFFVEVDYYPFAPLWCFFRSEKETHTSRCLMKMRQNACCSRQTHDATVHIRQIYRKRHFFKPDITPRTWCKPLLSHPIWVR